MSTNSIHIDADLRAVYDLLLDPHSFPRWVVGARRIRAIDPTWPAVGSSFHHESGAWPLVTRDRTEMVRCVRPREVELLAYARPTGVASVRILVEPDGGDGTRVTIEEKPVDGLAKRVWNPLFEATLHVRNVESLRRLRRLAEERARDRGA